MSGRWFRFYDNVVDDPKVQRLSSQMFRFWVNCLCLASKNDGVLPPLVDMEFSLRLSQKSIVSGLETLKIAGLVDQIETGLEPHNWNARQFKSDVSTERVKRFRERSEKQPETVSRNAPEQRQSRTETGTSSLRSDVARPKRKASLPENFPDEFSRKWAENHWLQKGRADLCAAMADEAAKFRDYHTANAKPSADWAASWRTWCKNAMNFSRKHINGNGNRKSSGHENMLQAAISIAREGDPNFSDAD